MIDANKKNIVIRRLNGESVRRMESSIPLTAQCMSAYLKEVLARIVDAPSEPCPRPKISQEEIETLAEALVCKKYKTVKELSDATGINEEIVRQALGFMQKRMINPYRGYKYSTITDWMNLNGVTMSQMAAFMDINSTTLIRALKGEAILGLDRATQIKEITGLSLREIYSTEEVVTELL